MKAKAAVLHEIGLPRPYADSKPLHIEEIDLAPPGRGELLVRIKAAGLCHSDLSVINGDRPRPMPMALGHEAAGIVEEVGEGVGDFQVGDHVALVFVPSCGLCGPCSEGRPALCEPGAAANGAGTLLGGGMRITGPQGKPVHHHVGVSAFAEFAVVSARSAVKIDETIPFDEAALFGCAVLTGVGAVVNTAKVFAGASVAVIGLGGVGLNAMLGCIMAGADRVVAIDMIDRKLDLARQLGATDVFNAGAPDVEARIKELTGGGVDYAFEMAGSAPALEMAYRITRRGGTTVSSGLANPTKMMSIPAVSLVGEERTLKGSYLGGGVPKRDIPRYIRLFKKGKLPVDALMSERIRLDEINEAFDKLADGTAVRQLVMF
ncbi:alcohol dehydrogenase [Skermanella stibiiresistens SB22]|uniref:Alcohol dehydrogenase n=1 Tax=Skermanella stibiiresistens SB22 TaxID=1385369 RepID=W9H2M8_9PROT|nr:zinc-dependent alcohol dehydrogenase family protein [Skermanella stibiiresistens]EWY40304.1 alcohol dehydrogenase [Skermanella stibiiresistens SB22]